MATRTLGTAATNTLTAILFSQSVSDADFATIQQGIKYDSGPAASPVGAGYTLPGAFSRNGLLFIPNRGTLQVLPGDFVCFDPTSGWPILISGNAAGQAGIVHS